MRNADTLFMSDLQAAVRRRPVFSSNLLLVAIMTFFGASVYWASWAEIDQATRGFGQVIPSSQIQIIQNLEGGIVSEILVREGQQVKADEVMMRLDDTQFSSKFREDRAKYFGLQAAIERLTAELEGRKPQFSAELVKSAPQVVANEEALLTSRQSELRSTLAGYQEHALQRRQEIAETQSKIVHLQEALAIADEEIKIVKPLAEKGVTPRIELLKLQRELVELKGQLESARQSLPRLNAALNEALAKVKETESVFRSRALKEMNEAQVNLNAITETLTSGGDRVRRTEIRAPVTGTIKRLLVNTVSGVVKPGMDIVEIVPLEDNLLVEAKVKPADIAFLHPGLAAHVKITAYDYSVYGMLPAKLEHISPDSIVDQEGNTYYVIRVRTDVNHLVGKQGEELRIIPGMTAEVDVLTGKRTVLEYILKPLLRAKGRALTER
jgi:adhesin transport system membrane fusion protein